MALPARLCQAVLEPPAMGPGCNLNAMDFLEGAKRCRWKSWSTGNRTQCGAPTRVCAGSGRIPQPRPLPVPRG